MYLATSRRSLTVATIRGCLTTTATWWSPGSPRRKQRSGLFGLSSETKGSIAKNVPKSNASVREATTSTPTSPKKTTRPSSASLLRPRIQTRLPPLAPGVASRSRCREGGRKARMTISIAKYRRTKCPRCLRKKREGGRPPKENFVPIEEHLLYIRRRKQGRPHLLNLAFFLRRTTKINNNNYFFCSWKKQKHAFFVPRKKQNFYYFVFVFLLLENKIDTF